MMMIHTRENQLNNLTTIFFLHRIACSVARFKNKSPKRLKRHCHWHCQWHCVCVCLHCVSGFKWNGICHKCHLQDMKLWYKTHGQTSHKNAIFMSLFCYCCRRRCVFVSKMKWKEMSFASIFVALARTYNYCMFWHIRYNIKTNCECIKRLAP